MHMFHSGWKLTWKVWAMLKVLGCCNLKGAKRNPVRILCLSIKLKTFGEIKVNLKKLYTTWLHDYAHPVPYWGMWLSSELPVTFSSLSLKSCDPVTIQNLRRTFALKGTKEEGLKRILLGASWNTVEHCHHQLEKIWHNSDTTKNWMSLRN